MLHYIILYYINVVIILVKFVIQQILIRNTYKSGIYSIEVYAT
jgi:hypothetical protein